MASENKTSANTSSIIPEDDFSRPFYLNLVMFIFGSFVAAVNTGLLYQMRKNRNSFKAKRFMFVANMTFCDMLSGLVMIGLAVANVLGGDGPLVCLLQGETCLNLCLTMSSYTCSVIVQFIAVRYPLYYKTNVTKTKVLLGVACCWFYSIGFSTIKLSYVMASTHHSAAAETYFIFPYVDVALKITYLAGNCVCFGYVLRIALVRRRQQMAAVGRNRIEDEKEDEDNNEIDRKFGERTPFRRMAKTYIQQYEAILTSGLRLLVYLGTCLPLTVFYVYVLATDNMNAMNPGKVYGDSRDLGVSLILLWFCRAIVDPLITLTRENQRLRRRSKSTSITSQSAVNYSQPIRMSKKGSAEDGSEGKPNECAF